MAKDVLKKPVHLVVLKPTHIQKLAKEGKLPTYWLTKATPDQPKLPDGTPEAAPVPQPAYKQLAAQAKKERNRTLIRTRLRVLHESIPPLPPELQAPCDTCATSACCTAFVVSLTKEEHESGLYGEYSIEITDQDTKNLGQGKATRIATMHAPGVHIAQGDGSSAYYLEGPVGQPCPFLVDNRCSIYEKRPFTCRVYSCVDDERITPGMRDGTEDIEESVFGAFTEHVK